METTEVTAPEAKEPEVKAPEEKKDLSLEERLARATEKKSEPKSTIEETTEPNQNFFGSDDDFEPEPEAEEKPVPPKKDKEPEAKDEKPETENRKPLTEEVKRTSARTAVSMFDMTQQMIFTPLLNRKFKRKFSETDINKLDDGLADADLNSLEDEEEKALKRKWDRLLKKHNKKMDDVPMGDREKKDMENAWYEYFTLTQKSISPGYLIAMTIANSLGRRAVDLFTD